MCIQEDTTTCTTCNTKIEHAFSNYIGGKWYCDWCIVTKDKAELAEYIALKKVGRLNFASYNDDGVNHNGIPFGILTSKNETEWRKGNH